MTEEHEEILHCGRQKLFKGIRGFFEGRDYLEVYTPILVSSPGYEPHLDPFQVSAPHSSVPRFLRTSPEFAMKRLMNLGMEKIFQIAPSFRSGEKGAHHWEEFFLLEWYAKHGNWEKIQGDCEGLFLSLFGEELNYQGRKISLKPPWPRKSIAEVFEEAIGLSPDWSLEPSALFASLPNFVQKAVLESDDTETLFFKIFLSFVEPSFPFDRPLILYHYPMFQRALAKEGRDARGQAVAERVELFIGGLELGNGYSEIDKKGEFLRVFEGNQEERRNLGKDVFPLDGALRESFPIEPIPYYGMSLGLDRLLLLLCAQEGEV